MPINDIKHSYTDGNLSSYVIQARVINIYQNTTN